MDEFFINALQDALNNARDQGASPKAVRVHPTQLQRIEADYRVTYGASGRQLEGVPLVADDAVPFGEYKFDR
jgi:hypothetical protein